MSSTEPNYCGETRSGSMIVADPIRAGQFR